MATVKITVRPNGPYRVEAPEGAVELVDINGTKYDLTGKPAFSLCRCGGSVTKPFCDGTHSKIGFQGAELAVKKTKNQLGLRLVSQRFVLPFPNRRDRGFGKDGVSSGHAGAFDRSM